MTDDELKAIEARANAATPGLETVYEGSAADAKCAVLHSQDGKCIVTVDMRREFQDPKAEALFIEHARTDIPALVTDLRTAREALRFYADGQSVEASDPYCSVWEGWEWSGMDKKPIKFGTRARKALGLSTSQKEGEE